MYSTLNLWISNLLLKVNRCLTWKLGEEPTSGRGKGGLNWNNFDSKEKHDDYGNIVDVTLMPETTSMRLEH